MTAIWLKNENSWSTLTPVGFPLERELQALVAEAPQLLPLSGLRRLAVLGREVRLGSGYADLVGIEPSGRIAVIEVKLAYNPEARRAVVAQILAYAAVLKGMPVAEFEDAIRDSLKERGFDSLEAAVLAVDQAGAFEPGTFSQGLADSLRTGGFRLVLVLDDAPAELVQLVGYLESIAPELIIDLITITAYEIAGRSVFVPQRVDPTRPVVAIGDKPPTKADALSFYEADHGVEFEKAVAESGRAEQLRILIDWAKSLESSGLAKLYSYHGPARFNLLPRLLGQEVGLVTIWGIGGATGYSQVFQRAAPKTLQRIDAMMKRPMGRGTLIEPLDDAMLALLTDAYREAHDGPDGVMGVDDRTAGPSGR